MKKYNRYHSTIKTSYALGIHRQILPDSFTSSIPRSTSLEWKNLNPEKFVGNEFASRVENDLDKIKTILDERVKKMTTAFYAFCRLYLTIIEFIGRKNFEKIILQNRESVIDLVSNLPIEFNRNLVCKFLQITPHQFNIWKSNRSFRCPASLIGYCKKRFPNQISQQEINILKSLMSRNRFSSWSIASVWGYALKKGHISMSRTSWYRYCLRLGVSQKRNFSRKTRKKGSVKASRPNEIWHADVTEFVTSNNIKFYIHTVLDNFSRKIIAYTVSRDKTAKTRLISLKEAILLQFREILSPTDLDLIVDGGSENNNFRIRNFIRHCQVTIHKKIALKDVHFSNSVIEGHFQILKKFLRSQSEIHSKDIHNIIEYFVKDYNSIRPHYQHWIHTPDEVHNNPELIDIKPTLNRINKERLQDNRTSCCKVA